MKRGRILAGSVIAAGLFSLALPVCSRPVRVPRPATGPSLAVITFNVNFGLAGDAQALRAIRSCGADVVFLQETTPTWERVLRRELGSRYPHMAFRHSAGAGGLAVLSTFPFRELDYLFSPWGWFPAWRILVSSPLGPLQVLQLHLRPPVSDSGSLVSGYFPSRSFRLGEARHFSRVLDPDLPTLVLGDLNEDERGRAVAHLVRARGLRSVLPELRPGATTWRWTTSVGITLRRTLDHILYSRHLLPLDARVIRAGRSDHLPVMARFQLVSAAGVR